MDKSCPNCQGRMVTVSIGWKCLSCRGFVDVDGDFFGYNETPFMHPKTNADRIRAMSDEELAEWIAYIIPYTCDCCVYQNPCRFEHDTETVDYTEKYHCREGIMAWLKQPAEEGHKDA